MKSLEKQQEVANLIRAKMPVIYIVGSEERRMQSALLNIAGSLKMDMYLWSIVSGMLKVGESEAVPCNDPAQALGFIAESKSRAIFVLRDFHPYIEPGTANVANIRMLRELAGELKNSKQASARVVVILAPKLVLPDELRSDVITMEWPLPDKEELHAAAVSVVASLPSELKKEMPAAGPEMDKLLTDVSSAAQGLTLEEAQNGFALSAIAYRTIRPSEVAKYKKQIVSRDGLLEWIEPEGDLDSIGGLDLLKTWLMERKLGLSQAARDYGLPEPKGIACVGAPGTGKSMAAKAVAVAWDLTLVRLDFGALYGSLLGESETNLRKALRTIEAVSPTVVLADELEKGLGGSGPEGAASDGGTSSRILGTFLTWMQERRGATSFVFACLTADSRVLLKDGTITKISAIDTNAKVVTCDPFTGKTTTATPDLKVAPIAPVVRSVTTTTGRFTATPDHPVYVVGRCGIEERPVGALQVGDRLARLRKLPEPTSTCLPLITDVGCGNPHEGEIHLPSVLDETVAEVLGFFCADGTTHKPGRMMICDKHPQLIEHEMELMHGLRWRPGKHVVRGRCSILVYLDSARLLRWFIANFPELVRTKIDARRVPQAIFRSPDRVVAAFLRGFMDGDGTVTPNGLIQVAGVNFDLIRDVAHLLHRLGIGYTKSRYFPSAPRRTVLRLTIAASRDLNAFSTLVGFACDYKQASLLKRLRKQQRKHKAADLDTVAVPEVLMNEVLSATGLPAAAFNYYSDRRSNGQDTALWIFQQWIDKAADRLGPAHALIQRMHAISQFTWDKVIAVEEHMGAIPVFDIGVPKTHTFISDGLVMHNTLNRVDGLPPELLRAGRWDALWYVSLPTDSERRAIFNVHLRKRGRKPELFDLALLANGTEGYSGAEIEQIVVDGMFYAFADGQREVVTADLLKAAKTLVPLSKTAAEKIEAMRTWAKGRARMASSPETAETSTSAIQNARFSAMD